MQTVGWNIKVKLRAGGRGTREKMDVLHFFTKIVDWWYWLQRTKNRISGYWVVIGLVLIRHNSNQMCLISKNIPEKREMIKLGQLSLLNLRFSNIFFYVWNKKYMWYMVLKKFIDPDCVERLVPDPVKIRPDPKPLHYKVLSGE